MKEGRVFFNRRACQDPHEYFDLAGSLSPSGDGLLADLFLGRPRSHRYPKFNIRRDIPSTIITRGIIKARRICCCSQPATSYLSPSARCAPVNGLAGYYVSTIGKPHEYFDLTGFHHPRKGH